VGPNPEPAPLSVMQLVFGGVTFLMAALVVVDVAVLNMNLMQIAMNR